MSGVTARTLRHYDEIGLLPPARNGRWQPLSARLYAGGTTEPLDRLS